MSSLQEVSDRLGEQNDLILEIGTDLYSYLDKVIPKLELQTQLLNNISQLNHKQLMEMKFPSNFGEELERNREQKDYNERSSKYLENIDKGMAGLVKSLSNKNGGGSDGSGESGGGGFLSMMGKGVGRGVGIAAGLGGLGLGIGAFFAGLSDGDAAGSYLNADMSTIKKQMITLGEAFVETPTEGLVKMGALLAAGGAMGALFGVGGSAKAAVGMGLIGAGIGAFFAGLAASDGLSTKMGADGSMIKSQMVNLAEGLNAFSGQSMVALSALLGAGALFGQAPAIAGKAAVGMGLIGAGLGAFLTSMAAVGKVAEFMGADGSGLREIMVNLAEGLNPLSTVNAGGLLALAPAMLALGPGIVALMGADGLSKVSDTIGSLFGATEQESVFTKIYNGLLPLSSLNADNLTGLIDISDTVDRLSDSMERIGDVDFGDVNSSVKDLGDVLAFTIPMLDKATKGGLFESEGGFMGLGSTELDFGVGLDGIPDSTFEKIKAVSEIGSPQPTKAEQLSVETTQLETSKRVSSAPPMVVNAPQTTNNNSSSTAMMTGKLTSVDPFATGTS